LYLEKTINPATKGRPILNLKACAFLVQGSAANRLHRIEEKMASIERGAGKRLRNPTEIDSRAVRIRRAAIPSFAISPQTSAMWIVPES
jgi:hypothetical protein